MKTVYLVRHAKSDWSDALLSDFDRPLNDRGKRDAPVMAQRLRDRKIKIDAFISSPAKRARRTAVVFAEAYGVAKKDVILDRELYEAGEQEILHVISETDNKLDRIAIFSHNPGLTDFANTLTSARIDNIPTCGIFAVSADCKKWRDFSAAPKEFLFFDYPRSGQ